MPLAVPVDVDVHVAVAAPLIVAVHVNVTAPVVVIDPRGRDRHRFSRELR